MHTFYHPGHLQHDPSRHIQPDEPGSSPLLDMPQRSELIRQAIADADMGDITPPGDFGSEPIEIIHEYGMLNLLQDGHERLSTQTGLDVALPETFTAGARPDHKTRSIQGQLGYYAFDRASPLLAHTWEAAYWSVQTAVSAAALVAAGGESLAYALCRPPGHHAGPSYYGGRSYLNNAAIAGNWLVQQGRRVAILDIDFHHGNGTQAVFYGRSDVLVCSIHADPFYDYPYFWGFADEFGVGSGLNYNYNFPLPRGSQETAYLETLSAALIKIRLYVPDILLVSFGANIADGDPGGSFRLQNDSFKRIGAQIAKTNIPIVVVQEGGYLLPALGAQVVAFFTGLLES
ncbi:MAG: histone deacetylase family protein [Chloroflexi bacterium]|nr:histone deacetylase family protein [Chloroflexota bacterium]MBK6709892.1 histone deacetylase family protein [Chloroflexota bacterium]MBK7178807.1 histone deacetylase family protein [Chloroflexota bacterium]MBK7918503.1 histone deacetylase family protein [Chloroflexota bacterium]MBK8932599.1 histone deacetylase family protein [Chloroflexota bacterium]